MATQTLTLPTPCPLCEGGALDTRTLTVGRYGWPCGHEVTVVADRDGNPSAIQWEE